MKATSRKNENHFKRGTEKIMSDNVLTFLCYFQLHLLYNSYDTFSGIHQGMGRTKLGANRDQRNNLNTSAISWYNFPYTKPAMLTFKPCRPIKFANTQEMHLTWQAPDPSWVVPIYAVVLLLPLLPTIMIAINNSDQHGIHRNNIPINQNHSITPDTNCFPAKPTFLCREENKWWGLKPNWVCSYITRA